ncbi:nitrate reductase molybdenum cofactor assembly chaperone [Sanguibacter sp. 25GB23B1]|uniref:nitrate reductase molybdenum cofactor assembly chaperone n=1 Tax=unclassified Sanguibacter TaxID=2645534 RepID=UPI0032AE853D
MRSPVLDPLVPVRMSAADRATAHMAASILLGYPGPDEIATFPAVRSAVQTLPGAVRERFTDFLDAADAMTARDPEALAVHYVATFDLRRKCSMYLTYFVAGDTRNRGLALVSFVQAYQAAGWAVDSDELPDYLPVVLEFSAREISGEGAPIIAAGLLSTNRGGIEVLRSALTGFGSLYASVIEAVCLTLPPIDADTERRYLELVSSGPPSELVGLQSFGPLEPFVPVGAQTETRV